MSIKKSEAHLIGVERNIYEAYTNGIKKSVLAVEYNVSEYTIKKIIDSESQNPQNETRNILSAHEDLKRTFNVGNKLLLKAYRVIEQKLDSGDVGTTELAKIVNALASSQSSLATQSTKASMLKLGTNTDTVLHNASKDIQERLKSNAESTVIDTSKY